MRYPLLDLEREADPGGDWISYGVRMKLDLVGCKISLDDWQRLRRSIRDGLAALSAETDEEIGVFGQRLERALRDVGLQAQLLPDAKLAGAADWRDAGQPSDDARALLLSLGAPELWPRLDRCLSFSRFLKPFIQSTLSCQNRSIPVVSSWVVGIEFNGPFELSLSCTPVPFVKCFDEPQ